MQAFSGDDARQNQTLLRDRLAEERTHLANERTFLAYVRTALALVISGVSAYHFLSGPASKFLGAISAVAGIFLALFGLLRFFRMRTRILSPTYGKERGPYGL
jgi:putative membrane protein